MPTFRPALPQLLRGAVAGAVLLPLGLAGPVLAADPQTSALSPSVLPSSPAAAEPAQAETELRISGPTGTVDPGRHVIGVRLLAAGRPVRDAEVQVQRRTPDGWAHAARVATDAEGLGRVQLPFERSTRLRAVYPGSSTRSAATSREIVVQVADFRRRAVEVASRQDGDPYRRGGTGPDSFDCSGLVQYSFGQVGKSLPRTSGEQARATRRISRSEARPGDLIFISSGGRVSHVGIYAGDGEFWDAPTSGGHVSRRDIWTGDFFVGRVD